MEEWTKYVLDNVEDNKVLHHCVGELKKNFVAAYKALAEEKNQLAAEIVSDTLHEIELLEALDNKINGEKKTTVVA